VLEDFLAKHRKAGRGIALLGLRGAGKTTLGTLLAERYGVPFLSVTREVERRAGMALDDLFNLGGSDGYRALENDVVRELAGQDRFMVIETAGGIVSNAEALELVLASFRTVWLTASPEEHLQRVISQGDMRPMHGTPKALEHLEALLSARKEEYGRADHVLDTAGRSIEACVAELE
jgi:XRE family aerobic/anaerobic benzoate catabolism transcriptional regulator